jgi:hypothetical protein
MAARRLQVLPIPSQLDLMAEEGRLLRLAGDPALAFVEPARARVVGEDVQRRDVEARPQLLFAALDQGGPEARALRLWENVDRVQLAHLRLLARLADAHEPADLAVELADERRASTVGEPASPTLRALRRISRGERLRRDGMCVRRAPRLDLYARDRVGIFDRRGSHHAPNLHLSE